MMKNFLFPVFLFAMSLTVTSSALSQEATKKTATDVVEVKTPSLTFYYYDQ